MSIGEDAKRYSISFPTYSMKPAYKCRHRGRERIGKQSIRRIDNIDELLEERYKRRLAKVVERKSMERNETKECAIGMTVG